MLYSLVMAAGTNYRKLDVLKQCKVTLLLFQKPETGPKLERHNLLFAFSGFVAPSPVIKVHRTMAFQTSLSMEAITLPSSLHNRISSAFLLWGQFWLQLGTPRKIMKDNIPVSKFLIKLAKSLLWYNVKFMGLGPGHNCVSLFPTTGVFLCILRLVFLTNANNYSVFHKAKTVLRSRLGAFLKIHFTTRVTKHVRWQNLPCPNVFQGLLF